jgi:hypothetical protein
MPRSVPIFPPKVGGSAIGATYAMTEGTRTCLEKTPMKGQEIWPDLDVTM